MSNPFHVELDNGVAEMVFDHPPVNAFDSKGWAAAGRMRAAVDRLREAIVRAEESLAAASTAGMEVSEAEFALQDAREALVLTRTQVHAFDADSLDHVAAKGLEVAVKGREVGEAALVELRNRRAMALIPLGAIGVVMVLLYRKMRELD